MRVNRLDMACGPGFTHRRYKSSHFHIRVEGADASRHRPRLAARDQTHMRLPNPVDTVSHPHSLDRHAVTFPVLQHDGIQSVSQPARVVEVGAKLSARSGTPPLGTGSRSRSRAKFDENSSQIKATLQKTSAEWIGGITAVSASSLPTIILFAAPLRMC
jgi:hypothetical protein